MRQGDKEFEGSTKGGGEVLHLSTAIVTYLPSTTPIAWHIVLALYHMPHWRVVVQLFLVFFASSFPVLPRGRGHHQRVRARVCKGRGKEGGGGEGDGYIYTHPNREIRKWDIDFH